MILYLSRIYNEKIAIEVTCKEEAEEFVNALQDQYPDTVKRINPFSILRNYYGVQYFRLSNFGNFAGMFGRSSAASTYTNAGYTIENFDFLLDNYEDEEGVKYPDDKEIIDFLNLGGDDNDPC